MGCRRRDRAARPRRGRRARPGGTGRLESCGKIGRVAVLREWRGAGIGAGIVRHLVNQATELGVESVYLHAQTAAAGFYRRLGFRAKGPCLTRWASRT